MAHISQEEQIHIDLILLEANAYNLRWEVADSAEKEMANGTAPLDAYQIAFNEWIK
jgi:hypothetical protein